MERLTADRLCRHCDPQQFEFETTQSLEDIVQSLGQPRAIAALEFGVGIEHEGYNLYAMGPEGMGKRFLVERVLGESVAQKPVPPDWCYVNNSTEPHRPKALSLPPGRGRVLDSDMQQFTRELGGALSAAFESDEYRARRQVIESEFSEKPEQAFVKMKDDADKKGLVVLRTPVGVIFAPTREGDVLPPDEFGALPEEERKRIEKEIEEMQAAFRSVVEQVTKWEREKQKRMRELNREVTGRAVKTLIGELRAKYAEIDGVLAYLDEVEQDVLEHAREIIQQGQPASSQEGQAIQLPDEVTGGFTMTKYHVNLFIDHSESKTAPVVFEDNPTFHNLVGRVEHRSSFGALTTNFRLIRAGALHRANGGFLVLHVRKLLTQPYAWDGLKRALRSHEIKIESLGEALSLISTASLEPECIPLDVKVVLLGDRMLYYLLSSLDPEFDEIFKVLADFDDRMDWTPESSLLYARLVATVARREGLRPFDRGAVARVLEHSARQAEHSEKLSVHVAGLVDLLREADYFCGLAKRDAVTAEDVERAVDQRVFRADRVRERMNEQIMRRTVTIDTEGQEVGQINGLSVIQLSGFRFGRPSRITAQAWFGKGSVIDIEREVELGGPLHSKGVLILSNFMRARYGADQPLAFSASIAFEQSYGGIEGDSASSTELYALFSAIARIPLRQDLAVTGSVDQHGRIQAIGGVNEKIEGFFDLCQARGLTGDQGVIIPATNVEHLMLRHDVVQAVAREQFHIHAVETVDEGLELLTGMPAGARGKDGEYPEGSVNRQVEERLRGWAKKMAELGKSADEDKAAGQGAGKDGGGAT